MKQMMDVCLVLTVIILNLMVLVRYRLRCRFHKQTYTSKTLFPFFDGLTPEGWMLQVVSEKLENKYPGIDLGLLIVFL